MQGQIPFGFDSKGGIYEQVPNIKNQSPINTLDYNNQRHDTSPTPQMRVFRDPNELPTAAEIESEAKCKEQIDQLMGRIPTSSGESLEVSRANAGALKLGT